MVLAIRVIAHQPVLHLAQLARPALVAGMAIGLRVTAAFRAAVVAVGALHVVVWRIAPAALVLHNEAVVILACCLLLGLSLLLGLLLLARLLRAMQQQR
jgi:hypothetical protein